LLLVAWLVVASRTVGGVATGRLFAPAISKALQRTLKAYIKERSGKPHDLLFTSQWNSDKAMSRGYFHKWFSETAQ